MRTPATAFTLLLVALAPIGLGALAQQRQPHPQPAGNGNANANGGGAGASDAGAGATASPQASGPADAGVATATDGGESAEPSQPATSGAGSAGARTFDIPMTQRGTGAMTHFPIPEQLARNDAPVFVQVRTSAPLDHVALFYRGHGARRYTEVRMNPMGAEQGLVGGYGAQIPCEDTFPPAVEYYAVALDTSGAPVGSAGSEADPLSLPIVNHRNYPIVPTLPGQSAPRNCGSLVTANPTPRGNGAGGGGTSAAAQGDGGAGASSSGGASGGSESGSGSADLGEPCTHNEDCHTGLRCGSTHRCVFPARR